jgi:hypothetical protein
MHLHMLHMTRHVTKTSASLWQCKQNDARSSQKNKSMGMRTHTHTCTQARKNTRPHTPTHTLSHMHTHTHPHSCIYAHTYMHPQTQTHAPRHNLSLSHTRTQTKAHARTSPRMAHRTICVSTAKIAGSADKFLSAPSEETATANNSRCKETANAVEEQLEVNSLIALFV